MADTVISEAVAFPTDEGFANLSDGSSESYDSAGLLMSLAQAVDSDSYVRSDSDLTFSGHDGTADTVDLDGGRAYLDLSGETLDVQSGTGSQSAVPSYDTTLSTLPAIAVEIPDSSTDADGLALQDSTLSDVWLAFDTDGTGPGSAGDVYVRTDDTGSVTAPSHPSVKLGQANPDDSSADVLANRGGSPTFDSVTTEHAEIGRVRWASNYASVQDAINACSSGDTVVVDREFTENGITVGTSDITIEGNGSIDNPNSDGTVKTITINAANVRLREVSLTNSGLDLANGNRCGFHILVQADGVEIDGVSTDGGKGPVKGYNADVRVQDCVFRNYTEHMTVSSGSTGWKIRGNDLIGDPSNPSQRGLYVLDNAENHEISANTIKNAEHRGIFLNRGASECDLLFNHVENITGFHGIAVQNDSDSGSNQINNRIIGNRIIGVASRAIVINGSATYDSVNTEVVGNHIKSGSVQTSRHGIDDAGVDTVIEDNHFRGTFNYEPVVTENQVVGGTIKATSNNSGMVGINAAGIQIKSVDIIANGAGYHPISGSVDDVEVKDVSVEGVAGQRCIQATGADWEIVGCHTEGGSVGINDSGDYALIDGCTARDGISTTTNTITGTNKTTFGS